MEFQQCRYWNEHDEGSRDKTVFMGDVCWPPAAIDAATFANNILFGAQYSGSGWCITV